MLATLRLEAAGRPLTLATEWVQHAGAPPGRATAFDIGVAWGTGRGRGAWRVYYTFLDIDEDAVVGLVSQNDLPRSTNLRGHLFAARWPLLDRLDLHAWAPTARPKAFPTSGYDWRYRLDLNIAYSAPAPTGAERPAKCVRAGSPRSIRTGRSLP